MSFFKSWAKVVYEKVVEDDYIQPLDTSTIYTIIQRTRSRKLSLNYSDDIDNIAQNYKDIIETLDRFALTSPDRELKRLGTDLSGISTRIKDLQSHLEQVQSIMSQSYNKYKTAVQKSLALANCSQQIKSTTRKSNQLKQKLKNLQLTAKYIKNVSRRNIKMKNIKSTLQYLKAIPNLKKMSLSQLKIVKIDSTISSKFVCVKNFDHFVDRQMTLQLKIVIDVMKQCVTNFNSEKYFQAITDFMVIKQHQNITYQKLLLKIIETEIRNTSHLTLQQNLHFFLKIILNLHRICSWHRENQQKVKSQFQKGPLSTISVNQITINFQQCQENVQSLMDQSLAYTIPEKLMLADLLQSLQTLYLLNRFFQIGWKFSGKHYVCSVEQIHNFLQKKVKNIAKRALNELADNLLLEENNQWSRLPVLNSYRHPGIEKSISIIERYMKSEICRKNGPQNLCFLHKYSSEEQFIKIVTRQSQDEESFQLKLLKLPLIENIQLSTKNSILNYESEVVLCQSALNMLKNIEIFINFLFYYPIVQDCAIQALCSLVEFYIHYLYTVFLSSQLKRYIEQDFNDLESKYTQLRMQSKYPNLFKHIRTLNKPNLQGSPKKDGKQSKKQDKLIIRSRVVSLQSGKFMIAYIQSALKIIMGMQNTKLGRLETILEQLNDFIILDSIPKLCNLQNTQNIISGVRWNVDRDFESAISIMELIMKDFFNKLKAVGKGQIPQKKIHVLFAVFWKTQLTYMISRFLKDYKPGKKNKINFEQFLDQLYGKIKELESDGILLQTYKRIKKVMPIIYQPDIDKVLEMIKSLLSSYEFVIKVQFTIFRASQCVQGLTSRQLQSYQQYLLRWTQENCIN